MRKDGKYFLSLLTTFRKGRGAALEKRKTPILPCLKEQYFGVEDSVQIILFICEIGPRSPMLQLHHRCAVRIIDAITLPS